MDDAAFDHRRFLANLSHRPGVYRMLDGDGGILYVGKARDLRKRVGSYFSGKAKDAKTMALVAEIRDIEVTVTNTEAEALILEHNLIKRERPRYNVLLKDDKSYPWIHVTDHAYPRLAFHRGARSARGRYFGPYPSAGAVRRTLGELQKLFLLRNCTDTFFANRSRPCLQYQIRRCSAPCVGHIGEADYARDVQNAIAFLEGRNQAVIDSLVERMEAAAEALEFERAAQFRDQIARLKRVDAEQMVSRESATDVDAVALARRGSIVCVAVLFVRHGRLLGSRSHYPKVAPDTPDDEVLSSFLGQYYLESAPPREILVERAVEDADLLGEALTGRAGHRVEVRHRVRGDRARWLQMAATNARQGADLRAAGNAGVRRQLEALAEALELDDVPERLECFDISHTGGEATVASCVVFGPEGPMKSDYRRFNIRGTAAGDDYAAMREVLERRYKRVKKGEVPLPDLVLIDGGRGQRTQALEILADLDLEFLKVVAVAKGRARRPGSEQLWVEEEAYPRTLPSGSPALLLLQNIRDEAHRFAITGHRARRAKARRGSVLEDIPGLGPKRRRDLLRHFGGLKGVSAAGMDDLTKVPGISRVLAERIYTVLHAEQEPAGEAQPN
ncbi:excinuclease ABC subunit UvrC [Lentisalinibacter orientalis]|uniref:excinuclease ABC subunit UvrC n=1 Tax=Lentisalinibacter orientalis TaxID=2992241 RepID=UPI00386C695E